MTDRSHIPVHVGLIMDGNGRWAEKRLMPRNFGHNAGMEAMIKLADHARELGVKYLTVYALSTENLVSRPQEEIDGLFDLLRKYFSKYAKSMRKRNISARVIGDKSALPEDIYKLLCEVEEKSPQDADFTLTFAINYGSRAEIARALKLLADSGKEITDENISRSLYTAGLPDPDLIIRTGGEIRLSNFLCWQAAYSELYFTPVLFPDFTSEEFDKALSEYSERNRRFGGI